jgi:hypothetical protein
VPRKKNVMPEGPPWGLIWQEMTEHNRRLREVFASWAADNARERERDRREAEEFVRRLKELML